MMFLLIATICLSNLFNPQTARADETGTDGQSVKPPIGYVSIIQYPAKTTYSQGENLDFSDLKLQVYYTDGTYEYVTDYIVTGYDSNRIGPQTITIGYQGFSFSISVTVFPAKVMNIKAAAYNMNSVTLTWDAVPGVLSYEIYTYNMYSATYVLTSTVYTNNFTLMNPPATPFSIEISAVVSSGGLDYRGPLSDIYYGATAPDAVLGLFVTGTTANSISLTWNPVAGASGYVVYRSSDEGKSYGACNVVTTTSYTDEKLSSGKAYQYKICAFVYSKDFEGAPSNITDTSTNTAKMLLKCKGGENKLRITWNAVNGASSYDIYVGDEINGYMTTTLNSTSKSYTVEGLTTGQTYSIYAVAHRIYNGMDYPGQQSDTSSVTIYEIPATSTEAKIFAASADFKNSLSYNNIAFFKKYVKYSKSYIMPGMVSTNVGGFESSAMCPQAITFAGQYLLMTAYDLTNEENSVIYVLDKKSKVLLTTLVLPSKTHAGGITYDGYSIWITTGTKVASIPLYEIENAVEEGLPYSAITYNTTCSVGITASYVAYFNDMLWVGSYNELKATYMYSFEIVDQDIAPTLIAGDKIAMPTRVQGVAFTDKGVLIVSRSCQLYKGLRGYMRQLDLYQPDFENTCDGVIPRGDLINTVEMPSMNEGVAIDGSYLYVSYESAAFANASYQMDRICAFALSSLTKKVL